MITLFRALPASKNSVQRAAGWALSFAILFVSPSSWADENDRPKELCVLLENGEVLRGSVQREPDHLLIRQNAGIQIRMPRSQVRFIGADMTAVYRHRAAGLAESNVDAHLDLASWCLQHELGAEAAQHVLRAEALDAEHARVGQLKARLEHARDKPRRRSPKTSRPDAVTTQCDVTDEPALHTEPKLPAEPKLPPELLKTFVSRVQPLLLNRCGAAHCHGFATDSVFQLRRLPNGGETPRDVTMRNLLSTLQHLNQKEWDQSVLLQRAGQPHGRTRSRVLVVSSEKQRALLTGWVAKVVSELNGSGSEGRGAVGKVGKHRVAPAVWSSGIPDRIAAPGVRGAVHVSPALKRESARPASQQHDAPSTAQADDPFDPELFNWLHGQTSGESTEEPQEESADKSS